MRKIRLVAVFCLTALLCGCVTGTQPAVGPEEDKLIVVGFSQVGAESEWRVANTESIKSALSEENGYVLIFDDARQEQENQIRAIRSFIQQDVDYIVFSPKVETGWKTVLQEARDAGIPVIMMTVMWKWKARILSGYISVLISMKRGKGLSDGLKSIWKTWGEVMSL